MDKVRRREGELYKAGKQDRHPHLGRNALLKAGHETAGTRNGHHSLPFQLPRAFQKGLHQFRRGIEEHPGHIHAADKILHRGERVGQRIAQMAARLGELRIQTKDADRGIVVEFSALKDHVVYLLSFVWGN